MQQSTSDIDAQADAPGGDRRLRQDGRGAGLLSSAARPARRRRSARSGYKKHTNVAAFMSVFPMNAPRYAVYMMLDEPHGEREHLWLRHGRLGGRAGRRAGDRADRRRCWACCRTCRTLPAINQALCIPLQPGRPPGAARGPAVAAAGSPSAHGETPVQTARAARQPDRAGRPIRRPAPGRIRGAPASGGTRSQPSRRA